MTQLEFTQQLSIETGLPKYFFSFREHKSEIPKGVKIVGCEYFENIRLTLWFYIDEFYEKNPDYDPLAPWESVGSLPKSQG